MTALNEILEETSPDTASRAPADMVAALTNIAAKLKSATDTEGISEADAADIWVVRLALARVAWSDRRDPIRAAQLACEPLTAVFQIDAATALSESYVAAIHDSSADSAPFVLQQGLRLTEQLLVSESFSACEKVIAAIRGSFMDSISAEDRRLLDQFNGDVRSMAASRSSTDLGTRGHYECLMRRQWTAETLRWLTQTSDARIAAAARLESAADPDDDPSLSDVADRWLSVVSRLDGRAADSVRLHAIDLMRRSSHEASALKRLAMQRKIASVVESLPPAVRAIPAEVSAPVADSATRLVADRSTPLQGIHEGLTGRLISGNEDLGVRLMYELDVMLTPKMIAVIQSRIGRPMTDVEMVLVGFLVVDKDTTVNVSAMTDSADQRQIILIGDEAVEVDPLEGRTSVTLAAGRHPIRWSVKLSPRTSNLFLGIHDAQSGHRMPIQSGSDAMPTSFDVAMMR